MYYFFLRFAKKEHKSFQIFVYELRFFTDLRNLMRKIFELFNDNSKIKTFWTKLSSSSVKFYLNKIHWWLT